jgi:hypothetical protein
MSENVSHKYGLPNIANISQTIWIFLVMKQQDLGDTKIWYGKHGLAQHVKNQFYDAINSNGCVYKS